MVDAEDRQSFDRLATLLHARIRLPVFVGAGISARAGVPTAAKVVHVLRRQGRIPGSVTGYAEAMQAAFTTRSERRAFLERTFLGKPPADDHFALAELVEHGVLGDVFTTNFDHLTETALAQMCSRPTRVYMHREALDTLPPSASFARVVKLHGDFLFDSLANTDAEMGEAVSAAMRANVAAALHHRGLLVAGYAGDESVLALLEDLSSQPHFLAQGLWWIFHHPPERDAARAAARDRELSRVRRFLDRIQANGPPVILVRNALGIGPLLSEIGRRTLGGIAPRPFFGVGPSAALAPRIGEVSPSHPGFYGRDEPAYTALQEKCTPGAAVLVTGPLAAGKTRLAGALLEGSPERLTFYFSFRFCRNHPEHRAFFSSLDEFLQARGMVGGNPFATLFDHGGVVVLDDIPVELDAPEGSPGLPIRHSFSQVLGMLGHHLNRSRRGAVVLLVPSFFERTHIDAFREGVRAVLKTDVEEVRLDARPEVAAMRHLSPAEQSAVRVLAFLRFAEPLHVLDGMLQTGPGASLIEVLRSLKEKRWVVEIGGRYALRQEIAARRLAVDLGAVDECRRSLLAVGRHFEALANDAETLEPLHYALEAERAYFAASAFFGAEAWADGVRALGLGAGDLTDRDAGTDVFLVETLTGYYEHLGPRLFEGLPVRTLARWDQAFVRTRLPVTPFLRSLLLAPMAAATPLVRDWFVARSNLDQSGYRDFEAAKPLFAIRDALRARTRGGRRNAADLRLLADVHLDLGWAYQQSYRAKREVGQWRRWLRHAQLAERCYRAVDDSRGLANAGKMIGLAYLNHGRHAQALRILVPLVRRTAQMPGFASLKASILVNTCGAMIATGRRSRAEGFFHEACYQYSASGRREVIAPLVTLAAGLMFPARAARADPLPATSLAQVRRKVSAIWSTLTTEARAENLREFGAFLAESVLYYGRAGDVDSALSFFAQLLAIYDEASVAGVAASEDGALEWLARIIARLVESARPAPLLLAGMARCLQGLRTPAARESLHRVLGEDGGLLML